MQCRRICKMFVCHSSAAFFQRTVKNICLLSSCKMYALNYTNTWKCVMRSRRHTQNIKFTRSTQRSCRLIRKLGYFVVIFILITFPIITPLNESNSKVYDTFIVNLYTVTFSQFQNKKTTFCKQSKFNLFSGLKDFTRQSTQRVCRDICSHVCTAI